MLKVYLAHSSADKGYVDKVAKRLGRGRVVYDKMCFEPGVDFRESIRAGLAQSYLFVLFASKRSLESSWVKFEIGEAEWLQITGKPGTAIAIIIDSDVTIEQLPHWMQRCYIASIGSPAHATRIIQTRLLRESGLDQQLPFVGRETDLEEFAPKLITPPEKMPPRVIVVSGLDGIGRRTFARRALRDCLSMEIGPILVLEETDSMDMLHLLLLDETMELESRSEVARAIAEFEALDAPQQGREIARLLAIIAKDNIATLIVDRGALLDDFGRYGVEMVSVFRTLKEYEDTYSVLIQRRYPDVRDINDSCVGLALYRLEPLTLTHMELLLRQNFRMMNVEATSDQIKKLALSMAGYPPTVALATEYAKLYGLETLLADKSILADFHVRTFAPVLEKLALVEKEWEILRLLAGLAALSTEVLAELLRSSPEEVAGILRRLIDLNLVLPVQQHFEISPPIRAAVSRLRGSLKKDEYSAIATKLREVFWADPDRMPTPRIVDATIYALARSDAKELERFRDVTLPSLLYKVAKESYDSKNWDAAIDFAKRTLYADPSRHGARTILCKAWIRKEQWHEALSVLSEIERRGRREQFYLRGFLEWKRNNLRQAVSAFQSALRAGDRSIAVFRDLAHCLFRLGEIEDAKRILFEAPEWAFGSSYVVDLAAQIAITCKDYEAAEQYISDLEHIGTKEDFRHRLASLKAARRRWNEALADVEVACRSDSPRFEALTQRAEILIELSRFPEAEERIRELDPFGVRQRDTKTRLRCMLSLRLGEWREAEVIWKQLRHPEEPLHLGLRKEILRQKIEDPMTGPADRKDAASELERIGEQVELPLALAEDEVD